MPEIKSLKTILFENILLELRKKAEVEMIWLVYLPEKISEKKNSDDIILDIHDFDNAVDVVKKVNPDVVFTDAGIGLVQLSLSVAAKFLKIPVISGILESINPVKRNHTDLLYSYIKQYFEKSGFFWYKWMFLIRTEKATKLNKLKLIKNSFVLLFHYFDLINNAKDYAKFSGTINWVQSRRLKNDLLRDGFIESSLVLTGDPMFDKAFQRMQKKENEKNHEKIQVLFLTSPHVEHGFLTINQRNKVVNDIVRSIHEEKNKMELKIKIHPSSEKLTEYQSLISKIDPNIPIFQKGDVLDFIENCDVIIAFSIATSATTLGLILKKPIILYDFYNIESGLFLERDLVTKCSRISELTSSITTTLLENIPISKKTNDFLEEFFYKTDGKASERVCNELMNLLKDKFQ